MNDALRTWRKLKITNVYSVGKRFIYKVLTMQNAHAVVVGLKNYQIKKQKP